jgi:hypothetical protein
MSHRRGTGPTKVHELLAANLGDLIVPKLIVKAKDGTANVAITAEPDRVMVWLSAGTDQAAIGLVCERDKAPYLCLWDESPEGFPPLVITSDGVQFRDPGTSGAEAVKQYPIAAIVKALDRLMDDPSDPDPDPEAPEAADGE